MPKTIEKNGFIDVVAMAADIGAELVSGGMTAVFPTGGLTPTTSLFTLEAGTTVDALQPTQPWRIRFSATTDEIQINCATPTQLPNAGTVSSDPNNTGSGTFTAGHFGPEGDVISTKRWFSRKALLGIGTSGSIGDPASSPMSYRLSVSNHGIALMIWMEGHDADGKAFCWFVVQRPVSNVDGSVLITGKAPVFAVYSRDGTDIQRFVVREIDVLRPSPSVSATANSEDVTAIINKEKQVAISENNRYIITFPNGLNTQRYAYPHELDMIGYTSADVISQYSEVQLSLYGEGTPRKYRAMNANGVNNVGMRLLLLTQGAGIA